MKWNRAKIEDYPGDLWNDWDHLNDQYNQSHPMLDSRFVRLLIQYFPADIEVLSGREDKNTVALALLENNKGVIQRPYLPSQSLLALLLVPDNISEFDIYSGSRLPSKRLRLDFLAIDPSYQAGMISLDNVEVGIRGTDMTVDIVDSFNDYWLGRPKKLKKNMSRYQNRISLELGGYEFKVATEKTDISQAVSRYGVLESRGWKGRSGTALHPGNTQGNFYKELLEQYSESGGAFVFELWTGESLVASRLCITKGSLLIFLKTTFDESFKQYAFGRILLLETLRYVFEHQVAKSVDFYTNASKDQLDWATNSRRMYNVSLYHGHQGVLFRKFLSAKKWLQRRDSHG